MLDCHTHTANSPDGFDSPEQLAKRAAELGFSVLSITEHCESNRLLGRENYSFQLDEEHFYNNLDLFNRSMEDNISLINSFPDTSLTIVNGIELGQATHDFKSAEIIADDERLDFIIGSVHELPVRPDFAFLDYSKENIKELLNEYFEEIYKLCKWGKFDVLGHLTYPLRYIEGEAGIKTDITEYYDIIVKCFKELIAKDKGIEINSSGLRQMYKKTFPDFDLLKLYKECGGRIITAGSDSHCTEDLGKGINEALKLASEAGFNEIFYFKHHKPLSIHI